MLPDKMKHFPKRIFFLLPVLFLLSLNSFAQTTTKQEGDKTETSGTGKKKILIVPWEPRMFNCLSDVSSAISHETSQKFSAIEESFRKGMVDQLKKSFPGYTVASFMDDTAMKRDLYYTYMSTTMSFTPVNFPLNPTHADSLKLKQPTGVQKGQVVASTDETDKFMNTIILYPNLLGYLKKKYNVDYVLFLNEVDIENELGADPNNTMGKTDYNRLVVMHWTMFSTADNKRVAMGKTKGRFASTVNTPKKIIEGCFSTIAKSISDKFLLAVKPKE
jgi:hypothetical protein